MYKIGVDAGGTKTTACLFFNNNMIDIIQTGMGNVLVDFDEAMTNISQAISLLLTKHTIQQIPIISIGCAGGSTAKDTIKETLQQRFPQTNIIVDTDITMSHIATFQNKDGALLICGTGSVVLNRYNDQFKQVGGWGHLLGDEGSAYWIAKSIIKDYIYYLESGDYKSGFEQLIPILKDKFPTRDAIINCVYKQPKGELASLATLLATYSNNMYVKQLCRDTAIELVRQIKLAVTQLICTISFEGSVILKNQQIQQHVIQLLKEHYTSVHIIPRQSGMNAVLYM